MSVERRKMMQGYGAKLILTPGDAGMKGSIEKATELVNEKGYFMPMQFENPANPAIHEQTTGQEIINAFGKENLPDAFVAGVGTGGTLTGVGRALKKVDDQVKVYALEPAESPLLKEGHGGKLAFLPRQQVTLEDVAEQEFFQVLFDDRGKGGIACLGRISWRTAQLFKQFRSTGVLVPFAGYG